jgi:hypothetical protein
MSDPRIGVLHVGPMKTGTTFIQYLLRGIAPELASVGLTVPPAGVCHWPAAGIHAAAFDFLQLDAAVYSELAWIFHPGAIGDLLRWLDPEPGRAVLSSEVCSWFRPDEAAQFAARLGGVDRVVIGVRNYHELCRSFWGSAVRRSRTSEPYRSFQATFADAIRTWATDGGGPTAGNRSERPENLSLRRLVSTWEGCCESIVLLDCDGMTDAVLGARLVTALGVGETELAGVELADRAIRAGGDERTTRNPSPRPREIHERLAHRRGAGGDVASADRGPCACDDCRSDPALDAELHGWYARDRAWAEARCAHPALRKALDAAAER